MEIKKFLIISALFGAVNLQAQSTQGFEEFRKGILDDFQSFRKTVLAHYADFLNGTWHEYEPLEPLKKPAAPKPADIPNVKFTKPADTPVDLPDPVKEKAPEKPKPDTTADQPAEKPAEKPKSPFDKPKTVVPPEAGKEVSPDVKVKQNTGDPLLGGLPGIPGQPAPEKDKAPEEPKEGKDIVNFYGMQMQVPGIDFRIMRTMGSVADFARNWKLLDEQDAAKRIIAALEPEIKKTGLNDYLTYEFLCAYMDSKFPEAASAPKMSAVHYILSHLGYNARIALATKVGEPVLLMPAKQTLYGKVYMNLNGEKFYALTAPGVNIAGSPVATCDLPKVAAQGKNFDLRINGLNLPVKEKAFDVKYGKIHLTGTVNENLMPLVYRYPQMDTADFAASHLDNNLRKSLVAQIKEQLSGMEPLDATNELLHFVQEGFAYATDDNFHGFEKPYFLEENFYYPKNDCEDRAIFYTYMLWNALGVENHLLFYPGHESASVCLPGQISGTSYEHNGKKFYISDPTYVGSRTGQCMPQFMKTSPKIDRQLPE